LSAGVAVDVAIIGGGIVGVCAALELSRRGHAVALLESETIGAGSSGWCAGILSASTTVDLATVGRAFGAQRAGHILHAVTDALARYGSEFGDQCAWQTGSSIYLAARRRHVRRFAGEMAAHNAYGIPAAQLFAEQLRPHWRGFPGAIEVPNEHGVDPVALLNAIAARAAAHGALLLEHTPALGWAVEQGRVRVATERGTIAARHLLVATGLSGLTDSERRRINGYMIPVTGHIAVTQPSPAVAQMAANGVAAAWDTLALYHYVRYMPDGRLLIGGEEKPGVAPPAAIATDDSHVLRLHQWAKDHHAFDVPPVEQAWRATLLFPADGLPFVQARQVDSCRIVSVVTDGLPFGMALSTALASLFEDGGHWLTDCLSTRRHMPLTARLAKTLPPNTLMQRLAHRAAFKAMEWRDRF
jgi:glycine/D-amino acid oxidase-like deaminating enzyme